MSETQDAIEDSELLPFDSVYKNVSEYETELISLRSGALNAVSKASESDYSDVSKEEIKSLFSARKTFIDLDYKYRVSILEKIKNSGLLNLIEEIGGMREFARIRFSSDEKLTRICSINK